MAAPRRDQAKVVDFIINIINQYNNSQEPHESINFIHINSSLALALMGKTAIVTQPKASQIIMIPYSIYPLGRFRKKYGIYPLFLDSNSVLKKRQKDLPTYYLPGMAADSDGVKRSYQSLSQTNYLTKIMELHKIILHTLADIKPSHYIRSLKKLVMLLTNMMIVDKDGSKYSEYYLSLLNNERKMLEENGVNPKIFFDKYYLRIEYILQSKIGPLHADDDLRLEIVNQYPILFCSACAANSRDSNLYANELSLDSVKIFFTDAKYVTQLKKRLADIGRSQEILVYGLSLNDQDLDIDESTQAFIRAHVLPDLTSVLEINPSILQNKQLVRHKFMESLFSYLEGKELENLQMAIWLLKNADSSVIVDICQGIAERLDFILNEDLALKASRNKLYLQWVGSILTHEYLTRLKDMTYLKALLRLRQEVPEYLLLLNYEEHLNFQTLNSILEPDRTAKDPNAYLTHYLQRLQDYYIVLSRDAAFSQKHLEHISKRLAFVQNKFLDLVEECEKKNLLCQETKLSDLYASIKKMQPETKKHWFEMLFKNLTKHKHDANV